MSDIAATMLQCTAYFCFGVLGGIGIFTIMDAIADKRAHRKIRRSIEKRFAENRPFASEELILEADKIMHDDNESDNARDFAKRVYIIGRTAKPDED